MNSVRYSVNINRFTKIALAITGRDAGQSDNPERPVYALAMALEWYAGHPHDTDSFLYRVKVPWLFA